MRVFVGARVFDGERMRGDLALVTKGASVVALVAHAERPRSRAVDLGGGILAPGFVDWQVNGGGGHLFNAAPAPRTIAAIAGAHRRFATTVIAPTVVTDAPVVLAAALAAGRLPLPGSLGLGGREARRVGERLALDDGTLAGAAITLHDAILYDVRRLGASVVDALRMATSTPARLLGVAERHGVLKPGARADFVHLSDDLALRGVWFGGEAVDTRP